MAFTTAKRALSFQQKRAFIQEILFSFCEWGTLDPQKGTFFTLKKRGGADAPMHCLRGSAAPARALRDIYINS